jgi:AcrR family transcriptional regulator
MSRAVLSLRTPNAYTAGVTAQDSPRIGRRERLRAETTAEILDAARRRLATDGAEAVTLRAIARDLGTGASSLYRYFASRDDLITALLVEAFDSQADAVASAIREHADAADALRAALAVYRSWSLEHPTEFSLAYGTPLPGYRAPADRTIGPAVRVGGLVIDVITALWRDGRLSHDPLRHRDQILTQTERDDLEALARRRGYDTPVALLSLGVDVLVRIHGFVIMEVFGQLRPITTQPADAFHRTVDEALASLGPGS